jgi:membrane protein DedA with SNARE-associated domain
LIQAPAADGVSKIRGGGAKPPSKLGQVVGWTVAAAAALSAVVGLADYLWPGGLPVLLAWVTQRPYVSGAALVFAEEAGVPMPLPGDLVAMYAGHTTPRDPAALAGVLLLFEAAVFAGSSVFFLATRRWGRQLLMGRLGQLLRITPARLEKAEDWFDRRGGWAIVLARWVPGGRVPTTLVAGLLDVDYPTFARAVLGSALLWLVVCMGLGIAFGPALDDLLTTHRAIALGIPLVIAAGLAIAAAARLIKDRPVPSGVNS